MPFIFFFHLNKSLIKVHLSGKNQVDFIKSITKLLSYFCYQKNIYLSNFGYN